MSGEQLYEMDRKQNPFYHDGTPRPPWKALSEIAQWSWNKPVKGEKWTGNALYAATIM